LLYDFSTKIKRGASVFSGSVSAAFQAVSRGADSPDAQSEGSEQQYSEGCCHSLCCGWFLAVFSLWFSGCLATIPFIDRRRCKVQVVRINARQNGEHVLSGGYAQDAIAALAVIQNLACKHCVRGCGKHSCL